LLAPRGVPGRLFGAFLLLPLLWPARLALSSGDYRVDVLDVGQGLSVLVRTQHYAMLFDTAARSRGGFDLGDAVVVPALRAMAVARLDRIIVSHGDMDHAGGLKSVQAAYPEAELLAGEPLRTTGRHCAERNRWEWDAVQFRLLHPGDHFPELGNESSCVLLIEGRGGRTLLPGDIGQIIEQRLLRDVPDALSAELLVMPHHGSRNSSAEDFVAAVRPRWAVASAGAGNRFGHPHAEVEARYQEVGTETLRTAVSGRLVFQFDTAGARLESSDRRDDRRLWQAMESAADRPEH
jgi:competence protein ComEC